MFDLSSWLLPLHLLPLLPLLLQGLHSLLGPPAGSAAKRELWG